MDRLLQILATLFVLLLSGCGAGAISSVEINDSLDYYGSIIAVNNGTYTYVDFAGYEAILDTKGTNWSITYWMPACCSWNVDYAQAVFDEAGATYFELVPQYSNPFNDKAADRLGLRKTFPAPEEQGDLSTQVYNAEHYNLKDEQHMHLRTVLLDKTLWGEYELNGL